MTNRIIYYYQTFNTLIPLLCSKVEPNSVGLMKRAGRVGLRKEEEEEEKEDDEIFVLARGRRRSRVGQLATELHPAVTLEEEEVGCC